MLIVTLLITATSLAGCEAGTIVLPNTQSPTSVSAATEILRLLLPSLVDVQLKNGSSMTGHLMEINPQERKLTIQLGGDSKSVSIGEIERMTFKEESLPRDTNTNPIRGWEVWSVEPLSEFRIDASQGQAEIKQAAVNRLQSSPDNDSSQASSYWVQAIWFVGEPPNTMRLKVGSIVEE